MPQPFVRYEVADAIAHIVLDRPPVNRLISSALFASAPNVKKCTPAMRSVGSFACASATSRKSCSGVSPLSMLVARPLRSRNARIDGPMPHIIAYFKSVARLAGPATPIL